IESDARLVIRSQCKLRVQQLTGIEAHQLAILLLIVRDRRMRQSFQARSETAFRPAGSSSHSPEFALIAGEETDDQVGFPERISLQDEAFAHSSGHSGC